MSAEERRPMSLGEVARSTGDLFLALEGDASTRVTGIANDSRRVASGDLFICVRGAVSDGHAHAAQAAAAGAVALVVERPLHSGLPELVVADSRRALGRVAAAFLGHPGGALSLIGVTGTNGKTTTAFLLESIMRAAGRTPGLIGTIETRIAGRSRPGVRTTPESIDLQLLLLEMVHSGVDSVVMEVTSHALALHRVEGLRFHAAAFTNLSQDHLDFHTTMEDYFAAKRLLFRPERLARGAINVDDPYGRRLLAEVTVPCVTFGAAPRAQVRAADVRLGRWASEFMVVISDEPGPREVKLKTPLLGAFNVSNCLAAFATALQAGIGIDAIEAGIADLRAVPGRFEPVDEGQPFTVVVDYAHTPDSLDNVLREARRIAEQSRGRVLCAFGCGGDRDRGKRPLMGAVAARNADVVVVTSDNPRSEDPHAIVGAIVEGVLATRSSGPDAILVDRREAIRAVCAAARPGDVVVIAGKGHETGQEFADETLPFDDREEARSALREAAP
jgi:UDP-N-acetylmuramoyl-L-alanyl-D-glutamate--2,6-diaminopimelate ligase